MTGARALPGIELWGNRRSLRAILSIEPAKQFLSASRARQLEPILSSPGNDNLETRCRLWSEAR